MPANLKKYYEYFSLALLAIGVLWWFIPLPQELDPFGGAKIIGFVTIDSLLVAAGFLGVWLSYRKHKDLSFIWATLLMTPLYHFLGCLFPNPWDTVFYFFPFVLLLIFITRPWQRLLYG